MYRERMEGGEEEWNDVWLATDSLKAWRMSLGN